MYFKNKESFNYFLKEFKNYESGSQGTCFFDQKNNRVFKVLHQYFDNDFLEEYINYDENEFIKFKDIKNNTYIFPYENIIVNNEIVGYITDFIANAKPLYLVNPLNVSLSFFEKQLVKVDKDNKTISKAGIVSYDVLYNILYSDTGINIIDTLEYSYKNDSFDKIYKENSLNSDFSFKSFLIDGYFNDFVFSDKLLTELYEEGSSIEFLKEFRKKLSEYEEKRILKLANAKKGRDKHPIRKKICIRPIYK